MTGKSVWALALENGLSAEAVGMLLDAEPRWRGKVGRGGAWEELRGKGLIGVRDTLTRKGDILARKLQREWRGV